MQIQSPLKCTECWERLEKTTIKDTLTKTFSATTGSILCKSNPPRFRLGQKKKRRNTFSIFFYGRFTETSTGTKIEGEFKMRPFARVYLFIWFCMTIFIGGTIFTTSLTNILAQHSGIKGDPAWLGIFISLVMIVGGIGFVKFYLRRGKSDEIYITQYLQTNFDSQELVTTSSSIQPLPPLDFSMKLLIFFLSFFSVLCFFGSFTGVSSMQASSATGMHIAHFSSLTERIFAFISGILFALGVYGIWKRIRVTWYLGFLVIAASGLDFIVRVMLFFSHSQDSQTAMIVMDVIITIMTLLVGGYWGRWWYSKKEYFIAEQ